MHHLITLVYVYIGIKQGAATPFDADTLHSFQAEDGERASFVLICPVLTSGARITPHFTSSFIMNASASNFCGTCNAAASLCSCCCCCTCLGAAQLLLLHHHHDQLLLFSGACHFHGACLVSYEEQQAPQPWPVSDCQPLGVLLILQCCCHVLRPCLQMK
jgi:hypothetical protein